MSKLINEKLRKLKFIETIIKSIIIFVFFKKNIGSSKLKRIKNKLKKKINSLGLKKLSKSSDRQNIIFLLSNNSKTKEKINKIGTNLFEIFVKFIAIDKNIKIIKI